jgi:hypothetical protein
MSRATFNRPSKPGSLHSLKDRLGYGHWMVEIKRDLLAETEQLIVASRQLIAQTRPPELWPLYRDAPQRPAASDQEAPS